jgi:hypothetical protein
MDKKQTEPLAGLPAPPTPPSVAEEDKQIARQVRHLDFALGNSQGQIRVDLRRDK